LRGIRLYSNWLWLFIVAALTAVAVWGWAYNFAL
jgi:hypothetical protein